MKTINKKLFRDLRDTRGQVFAISMVIASGIATFIMAMSTLHSLTTTRDHYYSNYRFADVFASLKRAPESLRERLEKIDGVDKVETRVVAAVKLSIEDFSDPVTGKVISLPDSGQPSVNRLFLRTGHLPDPERNDEVVLNEVFANAHDLKPGDNIAMIIQGRFKDLRVVGVALSPEVIYQIAPGSVMPDYKRFGVMWMSRHALANAYDMDGAFNDVVITTRHNAHVKEVIDELDVLLEDYGGLDAIDRTWQTSHRFLQSDLDQLKQMATMFSAIFLSVAAFLLNIVVSRMINTQREQIATLKAFGYSNFAIALHYLGYVAAIICSGLLIGFVAGIWLGQGLSEIYIKYYRLPFLDYSVPLALYVIAALITAVAAIIGTLYSVARAAGMPPAQAMQPEQPAIYHQSLIEKSGLKPFFSQLTRMILRHIERKPVKSLLSVIGIAFACAIMVFGTFFRDAIEFMIDIEFGLSQRQDMTITFIEPTSRKAYYDLQGLNGVEYAEAFRSVPARLIHEHHHYRTSINAFQKNRDLYRTIDTEHRPVEMPEQGVLLTDYLGRQLHLSPGDRVRIEILEGKRPVVELPVVALISQYIGVGAYMDINALNALMKEGDTINGAFLKIDPAYQQSIYSALKEMPQVSNVDVRANVIESFYESIGDLTYVFVGFISTLAGVITFGVVYNSARIALMERNRELASMRVLGFTRGEISYILLGELFLLTLLALPLGMIIGYQLCKMMIAHVQLDIVRIPLIIEPNTYALAAAVVLLAAIISSLLVRSKLDHLDLVAVLKTKE